MDFLEVLEHHILDHRLAPLFTVAGISFSLTKHVLMMWIASSLLLVSLPLVARAWPKVPSGPRALLDIFVVFIRDQVVIANIGAEGLPYVPYFLSLFFFILTVNLLGLIPSAAAATGNISVTAGLAACSFLLINYAGIREHGLLRHIKNFLPHGLPAWLIPLMLPLEIMGLFTRAFALCIRLFANMIAGHIVLLAFLCLSFLLGTMFVSAGSVPIAVGLSLLETFVCFLQAYIFTFLTAIFVGAAIHPH